MRREGGVRTGERVFPYFLATLSFALVRKAKGFYNLKRNQSMKGDYAETSKD